MAAPRARFGSMVQTPSWRIPQEVTTTRTICLIDAVKSENCYGMKLPLQIGRKLWPTQFLEDNNVKAHLTPFFFFFFFARGLMKVKAIPNY